MKKHSDEILALNILIEANIINDGDFEKNEQPDFYDKNNNIGIEITTANNSIAYTKYVSKKPNFVYEIKKVKNSREFVKKCLGGDTMTEKEAIEEHKFILYKKSDEEVYTSFDLKSGFDLINTEVEKKFEKLSKYKYCKEYRLFVIVPTLFLFSNGEIMKEKLETEIEIKYLKNLSKNYERKFDIIYIYNNTRIYILDLKNEVFDYKNLILNENLLKKSGIL